MTPTEVPVALALLMFTQNLAGSVFFVIAITIFTETLVDNLGTYAPSVSTQEALHTGGGADAVRALVPPGSTELSGVLKSYAKAVNSVFYTLAALAVLAFVCAWGMGWKNVGKAKEKKETSRAEEKDEV